MAFLSQEAVKATAPIGSSASGRRLKDPSTTLGRGTRRSGRGASSLAC
jgi:hypothetical protein